MISRNWYYIKRWFKFCYQRWTRGWDDRELWNLDFTIAKFVLPRLRHFKELNCSYPHGNTSEEWDEILDNMILAFEICAADDEWDWSAKTTEQVELGLALFSENFRGLWS